MSKYTYTLTDRTLSVLIAGRVFQTDRSNPGWRQIKALLADDSADDNELMALFSPAQALGRASERLSFENGELFFDGAPVHTELSRRLQDIFDEGLDIDPWLKYAANCYDNPGEFAREELMLFQLAAEPPMPITPDGCFIAYKKVNRNYTDCYTSTFDNSIGQYVSMPREDCDPHRGNLCSRGLHFCSKAYLPHTPGERVLLVKINPKDVVSIPHDYNNAKGRTCAYEVVGELSDEAAQNVVWKPIESGYDEHRWGYDPADDLDEQEDWCVVEAETEVEELVQEVSAEPFVMSTGYGKITPAKFLQLLKKHKSLNGMARALGMSAGTINAWKTKLGIQLPGRTDPQP